MSPSNSSEASKPLIFSILCKAGAIMKILLTISYLGGRYHGWQVQKNAVTVQETVQDAIEKITGKRRDLTGCSRTDAGVHAVGYCCCFSAEDGTDLFSLPKSLNAVLPSDISVLSAREVPEDFHPRYSAKEKEYIYRIYNSYQRNPFEEGRAMHYRHRLDIAGMSAAAEYFIGTHDFSAFCASGSSVKDTVRTVSELEITKKNDIISVRIKADGFLYNMVRIIVGTLIQAGEKRIEPERAADIIKSRDRTMAGPTAPPEGLYLNRVIY